ncbi:MAG: HD family phosphohydrolase [Thermodesulfobacteriota bacterium]
MNFGYFLINVMAEKKKKIVPIKHKKGKKLEKEITLPINRFLKSFKLASSKMQIWIYLIILSALISFLLYPNLLVIPTEEYSLGEVANKDIKASEDFLVEDKELTKQRKHEAVKSALFVYDFDRSGADIENRIKESFNYARKELQQIVSIDLQPTVRSQKLKQLKDKFFNLLEITENTNFFDQLLQHNFSSQIDNSASNTINRILEQGVVGSDNLLMAQKGKGIILRDIDTQQELRITDFDRFYNLESALKYFNRVIDQRVKNENTGDIVKATRHLAQLTINPNITFNKRATEIRKEEAKKSVKPIYFQVKKGEMIVREGEKINATHLWKLAAEAKVKTNAPTLSMALSMTIMVGILLALSYIMLLKRTNIFKGDSKSLIFISLTLLFMFFLVLLYNTVAEEVARGFYFFTAQALLFALPITLGAILISIFQGFEVAIAFSLILSILASIAVEGRIEFFIYFLIGSLLAASGVRNCRERLVVIKTGVKVGLLNIIMCFLIQTLYGNPYSLIGTISIVSAFLGGALAGVIATGFLPLIEMIFGFTTDIKLLELSSLDQPILKDLMVKAPGSYHHSVMVSTLVEATAESINANPLLAKVSAYYHDIGKIKKPLYFVENQVKGYNKHEKLAPSMSSLILISHVKDGVELAKNHRLGKEIIDIIQQHHGTSLISYFYQKAKEQNQKRASKSSPIKEEDFRYPGPKPQTKEAGLVLVADAVEAASRTLVNPTPASIQGMVQKIINNIFSDGQLDECELTLKDLNQIAKIFSKTLSGIFHSRIEYPEPIDKRKTDKRKENGDSNNLSAPYEKNGSRENTNEVKEDLKRLGMS